MKKLFLSLVILPFSVITLTAQEIAKGIVFEDANKNSQFDRSEKRLADVQISNGKEVVTTNKKGEYQIEVDDNTVLFVIKPTGFKVPLNAFHQPAFYYVHKPQGSPTLKYGGSKPTGPLPKQINFPLIRQTEENTFSALIFGDPQAYTLEEVDFFAKGIVHDLKGVKNMQFGLSLGDLVGDDLVLHQPYIKAVSEIGIPWYNLLGNHDMDFDAKEDRFSDDTFENNFGPANYSFNIGQAHFIILDDVLYPDPRDQKGYWGGFREDQLQFIENDLKFVPKNHLVVLAFHIPLVHDNEDNFRNSDRQRLFDLLKEFPHTVSLSAHTHLQQQLFYGKKEGWKQNKPHHEYNVGTTSGDWYSGMKDEKGIPMSTMRDGTPKGYAIMHVEGNQYKFDYRVANGSAKDQIGLYHTQKVKVGNRTKAMLMANFYMGHAGDVVEYRIDQGSWKKMNFNPSIDYRYTESIIHYDSGRFNNYNNRPSDAVTSTHTWSVRLPRYQKPGNHTLEVKATDMYGQIHSATSTFEVIQ